MNRRGAGVAFCCVAAFLLAAKYVSAAIFGSNVSSWDRELFARMLDYTGPALIVFSIIAAIAGVVYLVLAEMENRPNK